MSRRWLVITVAAAAASATVSGWVVELRHRERPMTARLRANGREDDEATPAPADVRADDGKPAPGRPAWPSAADWRELGWLAIGGGPTPEYNEVGIEQDIALAAQMLGPAGRILFAGGPNALDVRETMVSSGGDDLIAELGAIFAPRGGRDSRYRRTTLPVLGAATRQAAEQAVGAALAEGGRSLLLLLAGHGDRGDSPRDNVIDLWGGGALSAGDLAEILDRAGGARPVQMVVTTCFGGGFAEAAFAGADPAHGTPVHLRCGLFATSADLPASGCDPDPDRSRHESYALVFWHALASQDERGRQLPLAVLDLDGDGTISALEAHTRARLVAGGVDVPTTTSERWLRAKAPLRGSSRPVSLVEEESLATALGRATGLGRDAERARAELAALEREAAAAEADKNERREAEDEALGALSGALLARWPILDDPWHPGFAGLVEREHDAIAACLASSPAYAAYSEAIAATDDADADYWELRRRMAPVARLARTLETIELAGRLKATGGKDWSTYQALLACERRRP